MRALLMCALLVVVMETASAAQFGRPLSVVEPFEAVIPVGTSQPFQLLDPSGNELASDTWSVSDPAIASLTIDAGHAILTGRAPGSVTVSGAGFRSGTIVVRAPDADVREPRWILRPLDGHFTKVVWAASTWGASVDGNNGSATVAAYYYEDRGPQFSRVRAIRKDGLQVWQWPREPHRESPRLISGDFTGGIVMTVGSGERRELFSVDIAGRERWRIRVPGMAAAHININQLNVLFYVNVDASGARLVGLNARTAEPAVTVPLDSGRETRRNFEVRGGRLICVPGSDATTPYPLRTTPVTTNAIGVLNLAYTSTTIAADAGTCLAGAELRPSDVRLHVTDRLVMLDLGQDFAAKHTTIEQTERDRTGGDAIELLAPMNELIVGPDGTGNFLPVRKSVRQWPGDTESTREEFVYRLASDSRKPMFRVTLPPGGDDGTLVLLLGDGNNPAYVSRGHTLLAFETMDGRERWRWTSEKWNVAATASLKGDTVLVREGDGYTIVNAGRAVDSRAEAFMLFAMRYLPEFEGYRPR